MADQQRSRVRRRKPGPVETATRAQLRGEGELKGNGHPSTTRAAAAVELARVIDARTASVQCPSCEAWHDVELKPADRDLPTMLRELRMTMKREVEGLDAAAAAFFERIAAG